MAPQTTILSRFKKGHNLNTKEARSLLYVSHQHLDHYPMDNLYIHTGGVNEKLTSSSHQTRVICILVPCFAHLRCIFTTFIIAIYILLCTGPETRVGFAITMNMSTYALGRY